MRTQKRVQKLVLKWSQIRHRKFFWRYKKILNITEMLCGTLGPNQSNSVI